MDLRFTPEENAFRAEVRAFMKEQLPAAIRTKMIEGSRLGKEDMVAWQRILNAKGWAVPHWPKQWGGTGWDPVEIYLFRDEMQQAPAPEPLPFGVNMLGPVLIAFGSEAQKQRFLPRIANLDDWWCQGFSEPGAGSDLASLKTQAKRDGDHYIVNGQKTWTTLAQFADWIFCLVRTDPAAKKQEGISFLLIDMKSPGITVRPIQTIDGGHEVNEVFFDDVKVPAGESRRRREQGLELCQVPARQRAHRHRPHRHFQVAHPPPQGACRDRAGRRQAAPRRRALPRQDRCRRDRAQGAGDDAIARGRRRATSQRRQQARPGFVDSQDQGLGDPADHHRATSGSRRALRAARSDSARGYRALERAAGRTRLGRHAGAGIFQLPQDLDLWRLERDSEATSSPRPSWVCDVIHVGLDPLGRNDESNELGLVHGFRAFRRAAAVAPQLRALLRRSLRLRIAQGATRRSRAAGA